MFNRVAGGFTPQPPHHLACGSALGGSRRRSGRSRIKVATHSSLKESSYCRLFSVAGVSMSRPKYDSLFRVQRLSEHMGPDTFFMFGPSAG